MSTDEHQTEVDLCRSDPSVVAELLAAIPGSGIDAGTHLTVTESTFAQLGPTDYHADLVFLSPDGRPHVILEVQQSRDDSKLYSWPSYVASMWRQHRRPVVLAVLTTRPSIARWAPRVIELGPGSQITVRVIGPGQIPKVEGIEAGRQRPVMAALSALAYVREPDSAAIAVAGLVAATSGGLREDLSRLVYDRIEANLSVAGRLLVEKLMAEQRYEYQSEFARRYVAQGRDEGRVEGRDEGRAEGLAAMRELVSGQLSQRFGELPPALIARIEAADLAQLKSWAQRLLAAASLADLFGELH